MEQFKADLWAILKQFLGAAAPVLVVLCIAWVSLAVDLAELKRWQAEERINSRWKEEMLRDLRRDVDRIERRTRNSH